MSVSVIGSDCVSAEAPTSNKSPDNAVSGLMVDGDGQFGGLYMILVLEEKAPTRGRVMRERENGCSRR